MKSYIACRGPFSAPRLRLVKLSLANFSCLARVSSGEQDLRVVSLEPTRCELHTTTLPYLHYHLTVPPSKRSRERSIYSGRVTPVTHSTHVTRCAHTRTRAPSQNRNKKTRWAYMKPHPAAPWGLALAGTGRGQPPPPSPTPPHPSFERAVLSYQDVTSRPKIFVLSQSKRTRKRVRGDTCLTT